MNKRTLRLVFLALASLLPLAVGAQAHTLIMKDGRQIQGTYVGGSQDEIQFEVNGKIHVYQVADVARVEFSETAAAAPAEAAPAPVAAVAPAEAAPASDAVSGPTQTVTVPTGTPIMIRMIDGIDSSTNKVGDMFHASLEDSLTVNGVLIAKKDADVYGKLIQAQSAGTLAGKSELQLELTGVRTVNGNIQPVVTGDYSVAGGSRGKQSAERIGGGAVLGAVIGAIAGGGKGAAIGAGVGAGAGTAVQVLTHGQQVRVPSETLLQFSLAQPFTVTVPQSSQPAQ
jgi:hypothetical protein